MIYDKSGEEFVCEGITYRVGDTVVATENSIYEGLLGTILEIRTDDDRETDNETPDIYCAFNPPLTPDGVYNLERKLSRIYGYQMTMDDIAIDLIIMAPNMIKPYIPTNLKEVTKHEGVEKV